ncbi:hypothetical protein LF845_07990 [Deferribacterales bacterium Es71-Z0220]|uniref:hypothetical protein n=1 Tax=Deferrivibrio essentukiensis TaxID=2880922 RepID=UPI001F614B25|nr:hypothetical protein [Deferrivibrio essentukiensis]
MIKDRATLKITIVLIVTIIIMTVFFPAFKADMGKRPLFEKLGYTPQGKIYKVALGEFRWFVGSYLSFKSIIYYGGNIDKISKRRFKEVEYYNLYRTLETSILLNPYNEDAYYFAQGAFTWDIGRVKEVNSLLEYVFKYRTWDFKIPYFLGFNYAYFLKDYNSAAKYYQKASELSGSPLFTNLAARYFYEGGQTELGIAHLKAMIKMTRKENIKKVYEKRLKSLEAINEIEKAIEAYKGKYGKLPEDINDLVKSGFIDNIPDDPYGGKFYLDKDAKVRTTSKLTEEKEVKKDGNTENK